jgi:hypothetical protein
MAIHKDLTGDEAIHEIMYVQSGDPGAVGAGKFWLDTTGGATLTAGAILKQRDAPDTGWTTRADVKTALDLKAALASPALTGTPTAPTASPGTNNTQIATTEYVDDAVALVGGGGLAYPDAPPGSPNTEDDEFDSSSLDAKWTQSLTGAPSVDIDTSVPSSYIAKLQAGGATRTAQIDQTYAPGGDFSLTAKAIGAFCQSDAGVDIWAMNTAETEGFLLQHKFGVAAPSATFLTLDTSAFNDRGTVVTGPAGGSHDVLYIHIQRVGTTLSAWYSYNGLSFRRIATHTKTFTVNKIRLRANMTNTATVPVWAGWDWVRRDWITF